MRILVTGPRGFIGSALVPSLQSEHFDVTIAERSPGPSGSRSCSAVLLGDIWEYGPHMDLSAFDAVIHLAGPAHGSADTVDRTPADYAASVLNLAKSAAASQVQIFIFVSSVKAAGESSPVNRPFTESDVAEPGDWYGQAKLAAEEALRGLPSSDRMIIRVLRPPLVYDSQAPKNFGQLLRLARSPLPLPVASLSMPRSLVHRQNLCSAIIHLLTLPASESFELFYVRDGRDISPGDLVRRTRSILGAPQRVFSVPFIRTLLPLVGGQGLADRLVSPLQVDDRHLRSSGWRPHLTLGQGLGESVGLPQRKKRLLLLIAEDWYFLSHRNELALAARNEGWEVHLACRVKNHAEKIRSSGIVLHELKHLDRRSGNPLTERRAIREIKRLYAQVDPDVVHHVALKPIIYGTLAARRNGITGVVNALAGMGSAFTESGKLGTIQRRISRALLQRALRGSSVVVVQNEDDLNIVVASLGVAAEKVRVIPGSGLDIRRFPYRAAKDSAPIMVCYSGRMLHDKGVSEFVWAIDHLVGQGVPVQGVLMGKIDSDNPSGMTARELQDLIASGAVSWLGERDDVIGVLSDCDIAVLASYREGLPKSLLEAASVGLPLVATDVPGCREIVQHGVTGLLVPARDAQALADAIRTLATSAEMRGRYGSAARELVERCFSIDVVVPEVLALYDDVAGIGPLPTN